MASLAKKETTEAFRRGAPPIRSPRGLTTRTLGDVLYPPCGEVNRAMEELFKQMEGLV